MTISGIFPKQTLPRSGLTFLVLKAGGLVTS